MVIKDIVIIAASYREFLRYNDTDHLIKAAASIKADDVLNSEKIFEKIREKINRKYL